MSDNKILSSHYLIIRFDQMEDGFVNWAMKADEEVENTESSSLIDLAEAKAPLAVMGIRALSKFCMDGTIYCSLEFANSVKKEVAKRLVSGPIEVESVQVPDGVTIN